MSALNRRGVRGAFALLLLAAVLTVFREDARGQTHTPVIPDTTRTPVIPDTARTPEAQAAPPPGEARSESPECKVGEIKCAAQCDPVPNRYPTYRSCLQSGCEKTEVTCLEKLVELYENRDERPKPAKRPVRK